jgi:lauroyl/myristoyl acyltransferase
MRNWFDLMVLGGAYIVTFLPQRADRLMVALTMPAYRSVLRYKTRAVAAKMERLLEDPPAGRTWDDLALEYRRMRAESHWLRVRSLHRKGAAADITLEGLEHLEGVLETGKGAILWRSFFCSSHIPKQALAEAGHPLVHLSHWDHGARGAGIAGLRLFPPLWIRAEVRHLHERVELPRDASLDYLRRLVRHLRANRVLSIFGNIRGKAPVATEILGTRRLLASGAPSLARQTGAALLTMYAVRLGPNRYRVVIEEPLRVNAALDRRSFAEAAVAEYARRVDATIRRHPESWYRWSIFQEHVDDQL